MDILIKNMEMPKNCCYCGFVRLVNTKACCFAVHDNHKDDDVIEYDVTEADLADTTDKMQKKPSWCPLVPVPEHGDLIDRDVILDSDKMFFAEKYQGDHRTNYGTMMGYEIGNMLRDAEVVLEGTR